jgi:hypothetical protein
MSYDLIFWRQSDGISHNPEMIAAELYDDTPVAGLDHLPIEQIVARVNERFPLTIGGGLTFWDGAAAGTFELYHSTKHVNFCCRGLLAEHCNTLIEIMAEFQCPLYDPQVNLRFDGREPSK